MVFVQAELGQHIKTKEAALRKLEESEGFCTETDLHDLKKTINQTEQHLQSLPIVQSHSSTQLSEHSEEFECMICYNIPPEKVFVCTDCEGIVCEHCKGEMEKAHLRSDNAEPLSCPQCRTHFVDLELSLIHI